MSEAPKPNQGNSDLSDKETDVPPNAPDEPLSDAQSADGGAAGTQAPGQPPATESPEDVSAEATGEAAAGAEDAAAQAEEAAESAPDAAAQATEEVAEEVAKPEAEEPTSTEATAGPEDALGPLLSGIDDLRNRFERLEQSFEGKIKYDASREAIIGRLHDELQEYKADLVLKILKPFAMEVIALYDDMGKQKANLEKQTGESESAAQLVKLYEEFQSDLEDALYRAGFESFETDEDEFDPKQQRVAERVETPDEKLKRKIARRVRKGFRWEDRVIRPQMVNVYVHKPESEGPS